MWYVVAFFGGALSGLFVAGLLSAAGTSDLRWENITLKAQLKQLKTEEQI